MLKVVLALIFLSFLLPAGATTNTCVGFYSLLPKLSRMESVKTETSLSDEERAGILQMISGTQDFDKKIQALLKPFKRFEMEEIFFRHQDSDGNPRYFRMYRNGEVLKDVELVVGGNIPKTGNVIRDVEFGYQNIRSQKVQTLGSVLAIEFDSAGLPKKFFFNSVEQKEAFRIHFFGRPFTSSMRAVILDINTAIFKYLAADPKAQAQIAEFEKKRGWPAGTAKKLGLVYYSKEVLDLKEFAFQNKFKFEDMAAAGWMKPFLNRKNEISYRDNYDNSIKIPFYDETNPEKIAFWRTRNLVTSHGKPKYLSWPKDRSLYEDAPLFEEFYNSWNLSKAKGKKIVLTEGEFKCAIGEMMTGIFHLGVPGISQFHDSMLASIVKAQPSEVVVLFDRDPVGKGLMRVDEVTDSQRASFLIAKRIEAAGIAVKVATLPDVYNGGKVGIDDLLLSHGSSPYMKALESAVSSQEYSKQFKIDEVMTFLTDRKGKIKNALNRFQNANHVAGVISLEQAAAFKDLVAYQEKLEKAFSLYMATTYPERKSQVEPSHKFTMIPIDPKNEAHKITTPVGSFEILAPMLKIQVAASDVKNCTRGSCFVINKQSQSLDQMTDQERFQVLSTAIGEIFPADDYSYIQKPSFGSNEFALLVIRKESRTPVAIVEQF